MPGGSKKGTRHPKKVSMRPTDARYKLWRSMRVLTRGQGGFTYAELCITSGASINNARNYVGRLVTAGYIERTDINGVHGRASFSLERDTGPNPPRAKHDGTIFDLNLEGKNDDSE